MTTVHVVNPGKGRKKKFDDPMNDRDPLPSNPQSTALDRLKEKIHGIANQVADDFLYYRNERLSALVEAFPYDNDMHYADRYYPGAKGGPLYIDSPATRSEHGKCEKKAHVLHSAGIRYCFILPGEFLEDVLKRFQNAMDDGQRGA